MLGTAKWRFFWGERFRLRRATHKGSRQLGYEVGTISTLGRLSNEHRRGPSREVTARMIWSSSATARSIGQSGWCGLDLVRLS